MLNPVYDPLIEAARTNSPHGRDLLVKLADKLQRANPSLCKSMEDGLRMARANLGLYADLFPSKVTERVRVYYGLAAHHEVQAGSCFEPRSAA